MEHHPMLSPDCAAVMAALTPDAMQSDALPSDTPLPEAHVAVLDDDAGLRALIGEYLERQGLQVTLVASGAELRKVLAAERIDALVLDLMMPGEDGLSILRDLAERPDAPVVLMLSAMAADVDRIVGLELGADDYLAKPVNPRELLARLRAVLRRRPAPQPTPPDADGRLRFAGWMLDPECYAVHDASGTEVRLTTGEFRLLHVLASRPGRVISRDMLLSLLHGDDGENFDRAVDVAVSRLRSKLTRHGGGTLIRTVRGEGYLFAARA
jgi:two-component system OmpR family response regulator